MAGTPHQRQVALHRRGPRRGSLRHGDDARVVGILDIFGFERFKHNSFEQLLINFANEKLQAQFNGVVFEQQQLEYEAEGIGWEHVAHAGNGAPLELLEGKLGVLDLLREQCRLPNGTDHIFCESLREKHKGTEALHAPPHALSVWRAPLRGARPVRELASSRRIVTCSPSARARSCAAHTAASSRSSRGRGCGGGGRERMRRWQGSSGLSSMCYFPRWHWATHYVRCVTPNPKKQPASSTWRAFTTARRGESWRRCESHVQAIIACPTCSLRPFPVPRRAGRRSPAPFSADAPSSVALPLKNT